MSLEESVVLVWKVGSSLSSFFNPGAPPRQGHGGSEPFKTLSFNVGDEGAFTFLHFMNPGCLKLEFYPSRKYDDRGDSEPSAIRVGR